jgi:prevent-host-death family protein
VETITVRQLRNEGGAVLDRVARGEHLLVTRDGTPVAELTPVPRSTPRTADLIARRRKLPNVDARGLRRDIDAVIDPAL